MAVVKVWQCRCLVAVVNVVQASAANKKKAIRSSWAIGMNKVIAQNVSQEKVKLFAEAFAKIQEATGVWCCLVAARSKLQSAFLRVASSDCQLRLWIGVPQTTKLL